MEVWVEHICVCTLRHVCNQGELEPHHLKQFSLSVVFSNDAAIQNLNRDFRHKDAPTNVLSFPAFGSIRDLLGSLEADADPFEESGYMGDVVLALETLMREAEEQEKTFTSHVAHMLVHGTLHLLGYDHIEENDAEVMEALEVQVLEELSIANPYN